MGRLRASQAIPRAGRWVSLPLWAAGGKHSRRGGWLGKGTLGGLGPRQEELGGGLQ